MKRTKSPALTSPWKIGFLVSLMLVFVSIGVSYYFVHQYAVPLDVTERDWLDRSEWLGVIRGEGFLFEVLPLVGLVVVTAMISYLTITAAVRKYKKYLDSGHDYKNLLSSLKEIEDLEDKKRIERIKNHPELKRLLLGVAESLEEKERLLSEREGGLQTQLAETLAAREKEIHDEIAQECERLSKAIDARSLDPSAIQFANPDLARLSKAIGQSLQANAGPAPSDLEVAYNEMRRTSEKFQTKLREISEELRQSRETAQGIEQHMKSIALAEGPKTGGNDPDRAAKEVRTVLGSLRELDDLAAAIDLTAEEARGVAINTALRAGSGEGTQDDLIRLAEDVKEVAGRFKDQAKRFFQLSTAMRAAAGTLETVAEESARRDARAPRGDHDLTAVLSRVSLWVERIVVLSDRVMNLSETYGVSMTTLPGTLRDTAIRARDTAPAAPAEERAAYERESVPEPQESVLASVTDSPDAPVSEDSEEFGFQTLDRARSIFNEEQSASESAGASCAPGVADERGENAEETETVRGFERSGDAAGARDTGARGNRGVFETLTAQPLGSAEDDIVDRDGLSRSGAEELPAGRAAEEPRAAQEAEKPLSGLDRLGSGEFVPSPRGEQVSRHEVTPARAVATEEADEEVIDLYALGAVDYDPSLHG